MTRSIPEPHDPPPAVDQTKNSPARFYLREQHGHALSVPRMERVSDPK